MVWSHSIAFVPLESTPTICGGPGAFVPAPAQRQGHRVRVVRTEDRLERSLESLERNGLMISKLYAKAWSTALTPTQHGWVSSIASAATIPVLSLASIGAMVGSAVAQQVPEDVYDKISNIGKPKEP